MCSMEITEQWPKKPALYNGIDQAYLLPSPVIRWHLPDPLSAPPKYLDGSFLVMDLLTLGFACYESSLEKRVYN